MGAARLTICAAAADWTAGQTLSENGTYAEQCLVGMLYTTDLLLFRPL